MTDETNKNGINDNISYIVMPKESSESIPASMPTARQVPFSTKPMNVPTPMSPPSSQTIRPQPGAPAPQLKSVDKVLSVEHPGLAYEPFWSRKKILILIIGTIVILIAGAVLFFVLKSRNQDNRNNNSNNPPTEITSKLPKSFLKKYFNFEVCSDQSQCGDEADSDKDGLNNYDEFKEDTNPLNPDSDSDGLADGDEKFIYQTDPKDKFTDKTALALEKNYTDGIQIKNGYDPLVPRMKMTDDRLKQISNNTTKYTLHEPSITTLKPVINDSANMSVSISSLGFTPSTVEVSVGGTVTWTNLDAQVHRLYSDPHPEHSTLPAFDSADIATSKSFSYIFSLKGTYSYHDEKNINNKGLVIVR
jgi:plastocyanin